MIGTTLAHYRIQERLGAGGMGEVFRATDERLGRDVALKLLPAELASDATALGRFRTEARALAALDHPNIVTVYSVEEHAGATFLTMGLVRGRTLSQYIAVGLGIDEFLDIACALCQGLAAAHAEGIVHRDLKPANVMIDDRGRVKILDFGLAKRSVSMDATTCAEVESAALTQAGTTLGTLPYMSPEQAEGRSVDAQSDLFSLGIVLYEMLTGTRPFAGASPAGLVSSILRDEPRPLRELRPDVPEHVAEAVHHCLEKPLARRLSSAEEVRAALAGVTGEGPSQVPDPARPEGASIAVLPLTDMSPDKDHDWFCEGMAEELINGLSRVEGLRVAARASAFQLKGEDVRRAGELLDVGCVLDGSLRTAGKRLRVTVQLASAEDGYQIWSKRYDRDMDDVFAVQDDIASDIVAALELELGGKTPVEATRGTIDVEAYHLYLKGRYHFFTRTSEGMQASRRFFEEALEKDPEYVPALTGLADLHAFQGFYGLLPSREAGQRALELAQKALALGPGQSEPHVSLAFVEMYFFKSWDSAVAHARRSLELSPGNVVAHLWGAAAFVEAGLFDEARVSLREARRLDPLSAYVGGISAFVLLSQFEDEAALSSSEEALRLNRDHPVALYTAAGSYARAGRPHEALALMEHAVEVVGRLPFYLGFLGWAQAAAGRPEEARATLEELVARAASDVVPHVSRAWVHAGLGELDQAFACLDRAVDDLEPLLGAQHMPPSDALRSDPRFARLLQRIGHPRAPR